MSEVRDSLPPEEQKERERITITEAQIFEKDETLSEYDYLAVRADGSVFEEVAGDSRETHSKFIGQADRKLGWSDEFKAKLRAQQEARGVKFE
ncbi:MAG: hypothetical protein UT30_C0003G0024 [Candidatus Uhrbacteria bacterium GW2011_GWF2_39_13]|uniref:Uncharacterized protein n=1 Tax=Candidatus Uhrbacteria bacterium GW2011_GWF2_39_13 TaxID=1618995 RepID=A0A0G0Q346_9BACT|nr:MAG: hypothetical protein UT30_C0003G0024 [Candidatus Uhrbacteria bacterium GW2011_GWF2_39_13]HAU66265.1 hypothetical protein [Candidatus Uhrbacteria bacterium]